MPNRGAAATGDPRVAMGYVKFDSETIFPNGNPNYADADENTVPPALPGSPPLNYRPHSLPHFKNVNGANEPSDPIEISYSFQMNRPNDIVKGRLSGRGS